MKRRGAVRRAKLYYLRERSGKSARIREKLPARSAQKKTDAGVPNAVDTAPGI